MMRAAARTTLAALSLLLLTAAAALPAAGAVRTTSADWTRAVSVTADGGFRMGNPKAKVALVEYASLVCPHCRHFAQTGTPSLIARYVRPGKVSYEYRPFILNGLDAAAFLVARCGGPRQFFPIAQELYATQPKWTGSISQEQFAAFAKLPQAEMLAAVANTTGLAGVGARHGISAAKIQSCVRNSAAAEQLAAIVARAEERGVQSTPTFLVNGTRVTALDWPTLEAVLKKPGG